MFVNVLGPQVRGQSVNSKDAERKTVANPYIRVHRTIARHRGRQWHRLIPVLAAVAVLPLVRETWLGFLPNHESVPVDAYAMALSVAVGRLANLIAAAVILASYSALVRGPDRAVLDVHPIRARELVAAVARTTVFSQAYLLGLAAVMLFPVAQASGLPVYGASLALVTSAWCGALGVGFLVHLGGVWAAYSKRLEGVLDALRGDNPRMQAALIYAPGAALLLVGVGTEFGSMGLAAWLNGWTFGLFWLGIPAGLGAVAWMGVGSLARRFYVRASLLLAEVDGAWAQADSSEHASRVYLQGLAQRRPELLRALRNGWRSHRIFATGGWVLGFIVVVVSWNEPSSAVFWGAGAIAWIAGVAPKMAKVDPKWLDDALGVRRSEVLIARAVVATAYSMGVLGPVGIALAIRHGASGAFIALGLLGLSVVTAASGAWAADVWRRHAQWAYSAIALVAWAGFVRVLG